MNSNLLSNGDAGWQTDETPAPNLSERIVEAVADAAGEPPLEISEPLYDAIDPDALERLVQSMGRLPEGDVASVSFTYYGYKVFVDERARISVTELEPGN